MSDAIICLRCGKKTEVEDSSNTHVELDKKGWVTLRYKTEDEFFLCPECVRKVLT